MTEIHWILSVLQNSLLGKDKLCPETNILRASNNNYILVPNRGYCLNICTHFKHSLDNIHCSYSLYNNNYWKQLLKKVRTRTVSDCLWSSNFHSWLMKTKINALGIIAVLASLLINSFLINQNDRFLYLPLEIICWISWQ